LIEVDDGSTVTDYLPEERARGITITAAAITFQWANHSINLIDTPGHADFTFEVSRSLRVLDGAVVILDGVAGVEAQTEKVWRQADEWDISRIVFVNKLDREGAGFGRTVREIASRLGVHPLVLQLPVFEEGLQGGSFCGVVDLVDSTVITWCVRPDGEKEVLVVPLHEYTSAGVVDEANTARMAMMEALAELDDDFMEYYLENDGNAQLRPPVIRTAIRTLTIRRLIVPLLCGASLRDIGTQPLLDGIINYLPSPLDRPPPLVRRDNETQVTSLQQTEHETCALAFKIVHDPLKGPLVFVRVYQGSVTKGMSLVNTRTKEKERANRLLRMYADESVELDAIREGNIGVVIGLKSTVTGDTLINKRPGPYLHLQPISTPPPVFIASIEPESLGESKAVSDSLRQLLREDPSLSVSMDDDSGQILLGGMGELHLEISRDRLVKEYGAKCEMGKVRVSYRETLPARGNAVIERIYEREIHGKLTKVGLTSEISALDDSGSSGTHRRNLRRFQEGGNVIDVDLSKAHGLGAVDDPEMLDAIHAGVRAALQNGSSFQLPLHSVHVRISNILGFENQTTAQSLTSAARLATQEGLRNAVTAQSAVLMEPFMKATVTVDQKDVGRVVSDLTSARGGIVTSMESSPSSVLERLPKTGFYAPPDATYHSDSEQLGYASATLVARVPLKEMVGYSKTLRGLTQGRGTFVMSLEGFERMTAERASVLRKELMGVEG
jgi:elongation factor G